MLHAVLNLGLWFFFFIARLFHQVFISFRKYIIESSFLNPDLHIILNDICCGAGKWIIEPSATFCSSDIFYGV